MCTLPAGMLGLQLQQRASSNAERYFFATVPPESSSARGQDSTCGIYAVGESIVQSQQAVAPRAAPPAQRAPSRQAGSWRRQSTCAAAAVVQIATHDVSDLYPTHNSKHCRLDGELTIMSTTMQALPWAGAW